MIELRFAALREIGGLFLTFPAIFPAAVSLIQSHEKERKAKAGFDGTNAASIDSAGAALGSIGLAGFALTLSRFLPGSNTLVVISLAIAIWLLIVFTLWEFRKHHFFLRRKNRKANGIDRWI